MRNPKYKFELAVTGYTTQIVHPLYNSDATIDWEKEQGEQFLRPKLSGKLTFTGADYNRINNKSFDTEFKLNLSVTYDNGNSWALIWTGHFFKTDCQFDTDNRIITVNVTTLDNYTKVMAGIDKEFDLLQLSPAVDTCKITKRPMMQVYSPGESVIACFLSGMYWEQTAQEITNANDLVNTYHFALAKAWRMITISGRTTPDVTGTYYGEYDITNPYNEYTYTHKTKPYKIHFSWFRNSSVLLTMVWQIQRTTDDVVLYQYSKQVQGQIPESDPFEFDMESPIEPSYPKAHFVSSLKQIYMRFVTDSETFGTDATSLLPTNDITDNNRNYSRVYGASFPGTIFISDILVDTPTKWGIYQPGLYYHEPYTVANQSFFPISRNSWTEFSFWFRFSNFDEVIEEKGRKEFVLKDAYTISEVIRVLLSQIAPDVNHAGTLEYSEFLYGTNPITSFADYMLLITPKSNILAGQYDQPAQKAPITLRKVLDMLRDCFRVYWFIDEDSNGNLRFRLEHIKFFNRGGSYSTQPTVGIDLTDLSLTRTNLPWAYKTGQFEFDKLEMPERYQFAWMDDVTQIFEGYPIDITSKFVQPGNIEEINIDDFTSDIDYMLLNPTACDEDGFALLGAIVENDEYKLPIIQFTVQIPNVSTDIISCQNGYLAFYFLQRYYMWDMPAYSISANIDGNASVSAIKKQKTQQVTFPALQIPDFFKLVKTKVGNGQIDKLSLNLSRQAKTTLRYDTN